MRALRIPLQRLAIATALALSCAVGLSPTAHADSGHRNGKHGWERHDNHGPAHRGLAYRAGHGHPRFAPHPHYGPRPQAWSQPRYYGRPHPGPSFGASIVFRSAPVIVAPAPRIVVPAPYYGVRELGPTW